MRPGCVSGMVASPTETLGRERLMDRQDPVVFTERRDGMAIVTFTEFHSRDALRDAMSRARIRGYGHPVDEWYDTDAGRWVVVLGREEQVDD